MNIEEQQNVTSYQEIFCDAVETIVAKRLTELKFDKTIQCTIIDDSNKDNGKYTVSDGTLKFEAYSDNKKLRKDDQVYVRIPGNDYSQKKDIVSLVEPSETEVKKVYVAPLDQIIPVERINAFTNLKVNNIEPQSCSDITYKYGFIDAIGVKAKFETSFIDSKNKTGVYGLKFALYNESDVLIEILDFNSKTFFGNPYSFTSLSPQQDLFILNQGVNLKKIECIFYADVNFDSENEKISVQDVEVILGYSTRNLGNNIVKIYGSASTDKAYEKRTEINLGLIWNRKDDYERYIKMPKDTKIEIFKENIVGVGEKIYESTLEEERTDAILLSEVLSAEGKNLLALEPDYFQTKFYAKITYDGQTYISNVLEYKNIKAPAQEIPKPEIGLEIVNKEDGVTKNYYSIYDSSGLLDGAAPVGTLKLKYASSDSSKNYTAEFFDGCVLRWMLPKNGTMLRQIKDAPMMEDTSIEDYYYIDQKVTANEGDTIFDKEFQYTVSEYYDSGFLNNVIKCIVYRDEEPILQAEKIIYFSDIETQGSGYRLVVRGGENLKEPIVLSIYDNQGNEFIDKIEPNDINCDIIFGAYDIASLNNSGLEGPLFRVEDKQIKPAKVEQYVSDSDIQPIIVKISVSFTANSGKKTLSKLYPIECFSGESRPIKQAPSKITYDNSGTKVFGNDLRLIPNEKDRWTIKYYKDSIITKPEDTNSNFNLLQIIEDNEDLIIVPAPFYMELPSNIVPVLMYENDDSKWYRPILVEQDVYGSPVLNQWDGKFSINEDEGTVMAAALAVGKKDYENRFNGVLVGQVDKIDSSNNFGSAGLYGYDKGAQVFGINTDGKAFLGASGNGRIWVNGENGYIASASWMKGNNLLENLPKGASGTKIDLKSGEMQMVNGGGKGYLKFTEEDGLQVKADKISITSSNSFGGENLLINTAPNEEKIKNVLNPDEQKSEGEKYPWEVERLSNWFIDDDILLYNKKSSNGDGAITLKYYKDGIPVKTETTYEDFAPGATTVEKIMTGKELANFCLTIAEGVKTLYVNGGLGISLTNQKAIDELANSFSNKGNQKRKEAMDKALKDWQETSIPTYGFDCSGLIKTVLWGWNGKIDDWFGGADYLSNGIPDLNDSGFYNVTQMEDIPEAYSNDDIKIGELLWMEGHVGIYVGEGLSVECSPEYFNCVQITACNRTITGYNRRNWTKHGKLPWLSYEEEIFKPGTGLTSKSFTLSQPIISTSSQKTYTLSGKIKTKTDNAISIAIKYMQGNELGTISREEKFIGNNVEKFFEWSFDIPEGSILNRIIFDGNITQEDEISFYHLQLEEGPVATAWSDSAIDTSTKFELTSKKIEMGIDEKYSGLTSYGSNSSILAITSAGISSEVRNSSTKWIIPDWMQIAFSGTGSPEGKRSVEYFGKWYLDIDKGLAYKLDLDGGFVEKESSESVPDTDPQLAEGEKKTYQLKSTNEDMYSRIEQTSNAITSTVGKLGSIAQFYGVCDTAGDQQLKFISITSGEDFFPKMVNELYPEGTSLSVLFTNGNSYTTVGGDGNPGAQLHISGFEETEGKGGEDVFQDGKWFMPKMGANTTVNFIYDKTVSSNGAWKIQDNGSYSQIKQTAESITSTVSGMDDRLSQVEQTAESITSTVFNADGSSKIEQNAKSILTKVENKLEGTGCSWLIDTNGFYVLSGKGVANSSNYTMKVDGSGLVVKGTVNATGGTIGGWTIQNDQGINQFIGVGTIGDKNSAFFCAKPYPSEKSIGGSTGKQNWVLTTGTQFGVTEAGVLYATDVNLTGTITATKGAIGDWLLENRYITSTKEVTTSGLGTSIWSQKTRLTPEGIIVEATYKSGNPIPQIKYYKKDITWYDLLDKITNVPTSSNFVSLSSFNTHIQAFNTHVETWVPIIQQLETDIEAVKRKIGME